MILDTLVVGPLQVNCYLLGCPQTLRAAIIDPGGDVTMILDRLKRHGLTLDYVINTHGHFDHVGGNRDLLAATEAKLLIHDADRSLLQQAEQHAAVYGLSTVSSPEPDCCLVEGDTLTVGQLSLDIYHTPGHSPGGVCLLCQDHLFCGDTLFAGSVGRTDLPAADHQTLIDSIRSKILSLPDDTIVHPGHGPDSRVGDEKRHNPFLQ
ncbi:MAG: MBL fold metallo-hydrolase [Desulfuromonas sp.]|nr:MAG: MBL fold metallo-hydrolase [Desulfuromonas sp.]